MEACSSSQGKQRGSTELSSLVAVTGPKERPWNSVRKGSHEVRKRFFTRGC